MKRLLQAIVVVLVGTTLCGCMDVTTIVSVKEDGSGYLIETMYFSKAVEEMMAGMMAGMGGEAEGASLTDSLMEETEYRQKASQLGEGVRFVSVKPMEKKDGSKGVSVLYAFNDVRKLKLNSQPDAPSGGGPGMAPQSSGEPGKPITFDFVKGKNPKLIINMPHGGLTDTPDDEAGPTSEEMEAMQAEMGEMAPEEMAMMKQMFDGMRVRMLVKVDGEIKKTNASFVSSGGKSGKKSYVTLMDMDFGKLMEDPEAMSKNFMAMGQMQDMGTAMETLKDVPGIKVETAGKVEVEF